MQPDLVIGIDRADLPLPLPLPLAGFAARAGDGPTDRVLSPLRLRTLALDTDQDHPAVLVSADLLFWGDDLADLIKDLFAAEFGTGRERLVLHATHTHSGPQAGRRFLGSLGVADDRFLAGLVEATLDSVRRALTGRLRVRVERASVPVRLGVDRRHVRTGGAHPATEVDHEISVLRFVDGSGGCAALLVQQACHPVLHHANAVSADFTGAAMTALERDGAGVALYLQGCCGDVNPDHYDGTELTPASQDEVEAFGRRLSDAVAGLLRRDGWRREPAAVAVAERSFEVPVPVRPTPAELEQLVHRPDPVGAWARLLRADPARLTDPVTVRLTRLALTPETGFLGFSAELVTRYGRYTKQRSGARWIALGYTNGMTGYLITARHVAEGGYEPAESPYYFGLPGPFDPAVEQVVLAQIDRSVGPMTR